MTRPRQPRRIDPRDAGLGDAAAEPLVALWALAHRDESITVHDCEIHCLIAIALAAEDDLVAALLLRKLRLARRIRAGESDPNAARMNSLVAFRHGTVRRHCLRLVHPRAVATTEAALSVDSAAGSGLIGLVPEQSLLWPDASGGLSELSVIEVRNDATPPGMSMPAGR